MSLFLRSCLLSWAGTTGPVWLTKIPSEFTAQAPRKKKARLQQAPESDECQDSSMEEGMLSFNKKKEMLDSRVGGGTASSC